MLKVKAAVDETKAENAELQTKMETLNSEHSKIKDSLEKEQQAAIEAEEQCTKLEGMKQMLEDEVTVSVVILLVCTVQLHTFQFVVTKVIVSVTKVIVSVTMVTTHPPGPYGTN